MSSSKLISLPNIQYLSSSVICIIGQNPGSFTLQGTNTYIIGNGKERILLDTGEGKNEYINLLKNELDKHNIEIKYILCSHWHKDHIGGIPSILENISSSLNIYKYSDSHDNEILPNIKFNLINNSQEFKCDGATLIAMHTPGHTEDHLTFLFKEENAIFSGDCILGEGTTAFQDLSEYMNSLKIILETKPKRIYPGHGPVIEDGITKIEEYIKHREEREKQILSIIQESNKCVSVSDIVTSLYPSIPKNVIPAAKRNVQLHINKLIKENIIDNTSILIDNQL